VKPEEDPATLRLVEEVTEGLRDTLAGLLDDVEEAVTRYVHFPNAHGSVAVTLFVAETHIQPAFDVAPYVVASSPVKRSGKSRLQEVCEQLVRDPLRTSNVSPAFLFRNMAGRTLLFDEVDTIFRMRSDRNEELAGMLNAGWRRGAGAGRMDRQAGGAMAAVTYDPFGPKLLCGIGRRIPETILDRAVPIRLERKGRDVVVARFRLRTAIAELCALRDRLAAWASGAIEALRMAEPSLPEELNDRAQDVWEPLLAIADAAGDDWPKRARKAAVALHGAVTSDDSRGVALLADIRELFDGRKDADRIGSSDLVHELRAIEDAPWADEDLSTHRLASMLKEFEIGPRQVRIGDRSVKGYHREAFERAWALYVPGETETGSPTETPQVAHTRAVSVHEGVSVPAGTQGNCWRCPECGAHSEAGHSMLCSRAPHHVIRREER
jgi:Protein of unknown function (DUF3631)